MNAFRKAYCRIFQAVFKLALPVLPYRDPKRLTVREEDVAELAGYADREANPLYPALVLWDRAKLTEVYRKIGGLYD